MSDTSNDPTDSDPVEQGTTDRVREEPAYGTTPESNKVMTWSAYL